MLQTFRKVVQNILEYAKIIWVDSDKIFIWQPNDHRVCTDQDVYWKHLTFQFALALLPGKECYMLQTFRKVAQNIPEYAKIVWVDSNKD